MKPLRNDPCPCGSGKKYKKCCAQNEIEAAPAARSLPQQGVVAETLSHAEMSQLVALLNSGRYLDLEAKTRALLVRHPNSGFAWKALGLSLSRQGKDALQALQKATQLLPNDAEAHNNLCSALRRLGQLDQALESGRRALQLKPDFAEAHNNLGNVLLDLGQGDDAVTSYRRALQLKPQYAEAHNNLGKALLELEQLHAAVTSCRRALEIRPQYAEAYNNLGHALLGLDQLDAAADSCRRALEIKPDFAEAHNNLGNALLSLTQADAAVASYHRALEFKPDFAEAHNNLGNALLSLHHADAAVASYRRALEIKPDFAEAHNNLGNALLSLSQADDAMASYRRALEISPQYAEAYNNLGYALLGLEQLDAAVAAYRRALEIRPQYAEAYNNLGRALLGLEQLDAAIAACRRALETKPDFAEAHDNLGSAFIKLRKPDEALASCRRALEIKPDFADAHAHLSMALQLLGRADEAEAGWLRALELAPNSAPTIVLLAGLRIDQGRFAEAEELYKRALSIDPDMPDAWSGIVNGRKMTASDATWLAEAQRIVEKNLPQRQEASLRFAMGKYCDDVKDFDQAWSNYHRANELVKGYTPKYDAQNRSQFTDLVIRSHDREWLSGTRLNANTSTRPVFIVGMPRSGTTLAEQILASHPAVFGAGELNFWNKASAAYLSAAREGQGCGQTPEELANQYLQLLETISADALRVVDKLPTNFLYLGWIQASLPQARIIHMRRNPIDTCLSIYFQNLHSGHPYATDLGTLAHFYGEYRRLMEHWRSVLPAGAMLEVPYEELVEDQEAWSRKMIEFIGLDWDSRCLDFHQSDRVVFTASRWQVKQKISKSSVARWRNYEEFVAPLLPLLD